MQTTDRLYNKRFVERKIIALDGCPSYEDLKSAIGFGSLCFSSFDSPKTLVNLHGRTSKELGVEIGDIGLIERRCHYAAQGKAPRRTMSCKETAYVYYKDRCEVQKWVNGKPVYQWLDGLFYDDRI